MSEDVVYSEVVFVKKQADKDDEDDPDPCGELSCVFLQNLMCVWQMFMIQ